MKILMTIAHHGVFSGGGVQLAQLAGELVARGHSVTTAFKGLPDEPLHPSLQKLAERGVRIERFHFRKLKHRDTISEILRLRKFLKQENFDIIHCFKGTDFDFVMLASWRLAVPPLFVTRGNGMPLDFFNSFKYRSKKVKNIIAVCETLKEIVAKTGRVEPSKIIVVYSGVNLRRFDPSIDGAQVRKELSIPSGVPVVGIIGSIDFREGKAKGGFEFAQSAGLVLEKKPETRFLCVGDIETEHFKPFLEKSKLYENFIFTGFRNDVERMLSAMDISVCPSIRGEGLMGALRESLAMKVPVVSTDVGGNKELVRNGETGYLVKPRDIEAMADRILKLLDNPEERKQMGERGRKLVEELCDFEKQVKKIESLYLRALSR